MSFDDTPVGKGSANSDPFDETPLPSMARSSSLKFGDIASRSKSSSIAFDYQVISRSVGGQISGGVRILIFD